MSQEQTGFSHLKNSDAWIESYRAKDTCCELMMSLPSGDFNPRWRNEGYWLEFTTPTGNLMGWMRFTHFTTIRGKTIFAATEWRSATDPAPSRQDVMLSSSAPQQAGNGYAQ